MKNLNFTLTVLIVLAGYTGYTQLKVVPNGNVGIGTVDPIYKLHVEGWGYFRTGNNVLRLFTSNPGVEIGSSTDKIEFWYSNTGYNKLYAEKFEVMSDISLKTNIEPMTNSLSYLRQLRGVSFKYINPDTSSATIADSIESPKEYGMIAQEVELIIPEIISESSKGYKTIDYNAIVPFLVEGVKEQQVVIDSLSQVITELKEIVNSCCSQEQPVIKVYIAEGLEDSFAEGNKKENKQSKTGRLFQNNPNPFSEQTAIDFEVFEKAVSASILIFDMQGNLKMAIPINNFGRGQVTINGQELAAGMYLYSLIVNNYEIDTKRMILIE